MPAYPPPQAQSQGWTNAGSLVLDPWHPHVQGLSSPEAGGAPLVFTGKWPVWGCQVELGE